MVEQVLFLIVSAFSILGGVGVVFAPNIIYAALSLLVVFACVAGFFLLNNADFLAIAQVLVYAVGLTIIILFGLMFTGSQVFDKMPGETLRRWIAVSVIGLFATMLSLVGIKVAHHLALRPASEDLIQSLQSVGTTQRLGELLYNHYVLPFELASILLLAAMVGAIIISKKLVDKADTSSIKFEVNQGLTPISAQQWRRDLEDAPPRVDEPSPVVASPVVAGGR